MVIHSPWYNHGNTIILILCPTGYGHIPICCSVHCLYTLMKFAFDWLPWGPVGAENRHVMPSASFFKIKYIFFGYFDPERIFLDNENKYFWGELTDISAKKEALVMPAAVHLFRPYRCTTALQTFGILKWACYLDRDVLAASRRCSRPCALNYGDHPFKFNSFLFGILWCYK